jgi:hypothetical protein
MSQAAAVRRRGPPPAVRCRLIGQLRVIRAIRRVVVGAGSAEAEVRTAGIADRPAAHAFAQFHDRHALARHRLKHGAHFALDHRLDIEIRHARGLKGRVAVGAEHARGMGRSPRLAGTGGCARHRLGAAGQAQPVDLADHGIPGDAAEFAGDLAGAQACGPQLLEKLYTLIGPVHRGSCSVRGIRAQWLKRNKAREPQNLPYVVV